MIWQSHKCLDAIPLDSSQPTHHPPEEPQGVLSNLQDSAWAWVCLLHVLLLLLLHCEEAKRKAHEKYSNISLQFVKHLKYFSKATKSKSLNEYTCTKVTKSKSLNKYTCSNASETLIIW